MSIFNKFPTIDKILPALPLFLPFPTLQTPYLRRQPLLNYPTFLKSLIRLIRFLR